MNGSNIITALGRNLSSYTMQESSGIDRMKSSMRVGQLVEGRVIDKLAEGKYIFRLRGLNLVAESVLSLKPGMAVFANVVSLHPKLVLKWANGRNEKARLKNGIKSIGVSWSRNSNRIAQEMLDAEMPFTRETFDEVVREIEARLGGNETEEEFELVLAQVVSERAEKIAGIPTDGLPVQVSEAIDYLTGRMGALLLSLNVAGTQPDENINFIRAFVSKWERAAAKGDVKSALELGSRLGTSYESRFGHRLRDGGRPELTFKSAVVALRERIGLAKANGELSPSLNKLLSTANRMVRDLDTFSLASEDGVGQLISLYPPIPLERGGRAFMWSGGEVREENDSELKIKIEFEIEPLGRTTVKLGLIGEKANVNVTLSKGRYRKTVGIGFVGLRTKMEELGYKVGEMNLS